MGLINLCYNTANLVQTNDQKMCKLTCEIYARSHHPGQSILLATVHTTISCDALKEKQNAMMPQAIPRINDSTRAQAWTRACNTTPQDFGCCGLVGQGTVPPKVTSEAAKLVNWTPMVANQLRSMMQLGDPQAYHSATSANRGLHMQQQATDGMPAQLKQVCAKLVSILGRPLPGRNGVPSHWHLQLWVPMQPWNHL